MSAASATAHSEYFLLKKGPFVFMILNSDAGVFTGCRHGLEVQMIRPLICAYVQAKRIPWLRAYRREHVVNIWGSEDPHTSSKTSLKR
jgi:hypothetical protein